MNKHRDVPTNNEADLEAQLHWVLSHAFPWVQGSLKHQTQFTLRLGHSKVDVDGVRHRDLHGRSDILIQHEDKPLAIVELKRPGLALTKDDTEQGLSYARNLVPIAPLVIVSNGSELRIYETYSGQEWIPADKTEQEFLRRLASAGQLATSAAKDAVSTLMGTSDVWIQAIQAVSARLIERRTGSWGETLTPYVHDFLINRRVSMGIAQYVMQDGRAVILSGPPLSGKSNVLRELANAAERSDSAAALMIEPDANGIYATISNVLANELGWAVTREEARQWLKTVSHTSGVGLLLLVDGLTILNQNILADLNDLSAEQFGTGLHIIVAVDDSTADLILRKPGGRREHTAFGRLARPFLLKPLDDAEFELARKQLARHRVIVSKGGESVMALREPWMLRSLIEEKAILALPPDMPSVTMRLPPFLDVESIGRAAAGTPIDDATASLLMMAGRAIVDYYLGPRKNAAVLQGISTYAIGRRDLEEALGASGVEDLAAGGYLKPGVDWSDQAVWFVRVPALIAKFVANAIAEKLDTWRTDIKRTAQQLVRASERFPFGEVVAADALVQWGAKSGNGSSLVQLVGHLLKQSPKATSLPVGTQVVFSMFEQLWHATVTEDGLTVESDQGPALIEIPDDFPKEAISDRGGWLILSHVAGFQILIGTREGFQRLDEPLLLEIGQSEFALTQMDGTDGHRTIATHDIDGHGSVICHDMGIVEPITWSIVKYILNRGDKAEAWIDTALETGSLHLMYRIFSALSYVADNYSATGSWARLQLDQRVKPAIGRLLTRASETQSQDGE